jgi:hypothetical protein
MVNRADFSGSESENKDHKGFKRDVQLGSKVSKVNCRQDSINNKALEKVRRIENKIVPLKAGLCHYT